ncbi:MAG: AAA family ATPase, partial [Gammaproteobacteria bacterium]|nr:AAA family ATPase [Gammaproteobacteria bacterium]
MYLKHFGLERPPFKITPDTSLFYEGGNRGAALEAVKYSILQGEGIIKVVGEVGSGKTMLCRMLEIRLPKYVDIIYLANPSLSPEKILHVIAMEMKLDVDQSDDKSKVMQVLQDHLLDIHSKGRQAVVFIEEA